MHERALLVAGMLLGCRHPAHAAPESPPPGAVGFPARDPGATTPQPMPQGVDALGEAAARELRAGPARRRQAEALLRAYRNATDQPHEQAWAESELKKLGVDAGTGAAREARRVGLLAPLSGRLRPVGERLLEGALLAADGVVLEIGDTRSDPSVAAGEAERLRDTFALVGPSSRAELDAVRARSGPPRVALVPGEAFPSGPERAAALWAAARRAVTGPRRVALLGVEGVAGNEAGAAVERDGAEIVARVRYAPGTKQFAAVVEQVARAKPDAVLVADTADALALIAPALAAGGLWPLPGGPPPRAAGRGVVLMATAEGASQRLLESAGRYLQGALLAPGFYPDADDSVCGPFVARFVEDYGRAPGAWEAFAFEAVRAAASARTADELATWRSRWPMVYRVDGSRARALSQP